MSQALYRKYRSRSLDELVGQEHVTEVLKRALASGNPSHAYLLTGPRGVGKTSIARILAHEINGLTYVDDSLELDIIEIDAASNRRIDDIRELRERVHIAPSRSTYKVYIIDEVHMLTGESFNALLKTLEEPPAHVVFILATTEVDKLPATIVSRAQTFYFRRIATSAMVPHLRMIADKEAIDIDDDALAAIATYSDGSLRDALVALDQVRHAGTGRVTRAEAEAALGSVPSERIDSLLAALHAHDASSVARALQSAQNDGIAAALIARDLGVRLLEESADLESLNLLDHLLEVPKSYSPDMKLFSVLMRHSTPAQAAAEMITAPPIIVAQVTPDPPIAKPKSKQKEPPRPSAPFDWETLVEHAKTHFLVLHSVLSKCQYEFDGTTLTLYSRFKLHKAKLEDTKYRQMLNEALESLTGTIPVIVITTGAKPINDEALLGVAAIMGGGEEVSVS